MPAFKKPIKGDLDHALSLLMHEARQKMSAEAARIKVEMAAKGLVRSTEAVSRAIGMSDLIHKELMERAGRTLVEFAEQMQGTVLDEFVGWARPHLDNISNVLLGHIPPSDPFGHRDKAVAQYQAVFKQRVEGTLRNAEIGYSQQEGFAARMKEQAEEWISAAEAHQMLGGYKGGAPEKICRRALSGLVKARAERFQIDKKAKDDAEIPKEFWWAKGHTALEQDWQSGDFSTWIDSTVHLEAFGVTFLKADIEKMIPVLSLKLVPEPPSLPTKSSGGRPPRGWWENLWVEISRQLYVGDLKPQRQADIEKAMMDWLGQQGETPAESTIRGPARKLWTAIQRAEN